MGGSSGGPSERAGAPTGSNAGGAAGASTGEGRGGDLPGGNGPSDSHGANAGAGGSDSPLAGSAGQAGDAGGSAPGKKGGCSCQVAGGPDLNGFGWALLLVSGALARRRRRAT